MSGPRGCTLDGIPHAATMDRLVTEIVSARRKFPNPSGSMTALTEEVGELAKALLDEPWENVEAEAIQVACMAIRVLEEGDPTLTGLRRRRASAPPPAAEPKEKTE